MNYKETRLAEFRFKGNEGKMVLKGYVITFNQESLIGDEAEALNKLFKEEH